MLGWASYHQITDWLAPAVWDFVCIFGVKTSEPGCVQASIGQDLLYSLNRLNHNKLTPRKGGTSLVNLCCSLSS
jgi:hypothetical protein